MATRLPDVMALGPRKEPTPQASIAPVDTSNLSADRRLGETAIAASGEFLRSVVQRAEHEKDRTARLQAEDAMNRLQEAGQELTLGEEGFANIRGGNAINRDRDLVTDYTERFKQRRDALSAALPEAARVYFAPRADHVQLGFTQKARTHLGQQRDVFEQEVLKGTAAAAIAEAGTNFASDDVAAAGLERYRRAATEYAREHGVPEDTLNQDLAAQRDKVWTARLQAEVTSNPAAAYARFQANQDQISPGVRLQLKNMLAGHALPVLAAEEVARGAPVVERLTPQPGAPVPGPIQVSPAVERFASTIDTSARQFGVDAGVMRRQLQAESGGNPAARNDADRRVTGQPSIGIAQFQPATAKRYGIDPTDPVQSIRGQAAYMSDLLKMFDGDYNKALAGYNWGEGNVQKAVAKWGDAWFEHAPSSTQAYVRKIVAAEQREAGATAAPAATGDAPAQRAVDYASMSPAQLLALKTGNPVIDAMPADDKLRTLSLIHAEALRQRQEKQALLGTREQDARASYLVNGTSTNAPTAGELVDAYGPIEGMKRARVLDESKQTGEQIQQMATLPTAEIQRIVGQKPLDGEGFAERQRNYELRAAAAQRIVNARVSDPVQYALATRSYGLQPLTPEKLTPEQLPALADELRTRVGAAARISADYGTAPAILTKPEQQALSGILKSAPAEVTKQYLAAIYRGMGDMGAYRLVMQQIAPDAPVIAAAGILQAKNAQSTGREGRGADYQSIAQRDVASIVLEGYRLMNPVKSADGKEHEGNKGLVRMPAGDQETLMRSAFDKYMGGALTGLPQERDLTWQVARAIYAKKTAEDNDQSGNLEPRRWESALEMATGGAVDHNGQKVLPPYGLPLDRFRDAVTVRAKEIAPRTALSANEIASMPLRNVGDGVYEVLMGSGVLLDKSGRKVLIDLNDVRPPAPALPPSSAAAARLTPPGFGVTKGGAVTGIGKGR